jgi:lysozyme C
LFGAFALTSLISVVGTGCSGEVPEEEELGESEDRLLAGRRLAPSEIAAHLRAAGFAENTIGKMVCTAKYESSFYERASNKNRNGSTDRGLFQINSIHLGSMRGCPTKSNAESLWNPGTNTKCALAIFKAQGINAWYGYRKHKSECDRFPAPRSSGVAATPNTPDDIDSGNTTTTPDDTDEGGGCWSGTLQDMVAPRTCVQSRSNSVWMQCMEGKWYRGGDAASGPYGECEGSHPL